MADMCYAIEKIKEEGFKEGFKEGFEQGRTEEHRRLIINMNSIGISLDMISRVMGKSIEEIESIVAEDSVAEI